MKLYWNAEYPHVIYCLEPNSNEMYVLKDYADHIGQLAEFELKPNNDFKWYKTSWNTSQYGLICNGFEFIGEL